MPIRIPRRQLNAVATMVHEGPTRAPCVGREHIRTLEIGRHAAAGNLLRDTILAFPSLSPLDVACAIAFEEGRRFEMQRARLAKKKLVRRAQPDAPKAVARRSRAR